MKLILNVAFLSYWHAGTGMGDGAGHDASVITDQSGLPFFPGKSLKGVLRNAMQKAYEMGWYADLSIPDVVPKLFGTSHLDQEENRLTEQGNIFVSNAVLPAADHAALSLTDNAALKRELFRRIASTKIKSHDEQTGALIGTAQDTSLRAMEVVVPLNLTAEIILDDNATEDEQTDMAEAIRLALPLIEAIGAKRTRGFGRVEITEVPHAA